MALLDEAALQRMRFDLNTTKLSPFSKEKKLKISA